MSAAPNAVVLGGAGFLGSHLTEALVAEGTRVRVLDRPNADLHNLEEIAGGWDFVGGDFTNPSDLESVLAPGAPVYHLVSTTIPASSNQNPEYDVETNLVASIRLLELCRRIGTGPVIFVSSGGTVYGRPETLPVTETHPTEPRVSYGVVKLAIEKYLALYHHLHGLPYRIIRLANPYGPRQDPAGAQGAATVFLGRVLRDEPITLWGDGEVIRDYVYVTDAVTGMIAAAGSGRETGLYNIGSGQGTSLNQLIDTIGRVTGREVRVDRRPARPFDVPANTLDIGRALAELGWRPQVTLAGGLERTWAWLREQAE